MSRLSDRRAEYLPAENREQHEHQERPGTAVEGVGLAGNVVAPQAEE